MMTVENENENKSTWKIRAETALVVISLLVNFAVMVQWFTALERRLTKIETTIEIKLDNRSPYFNHYEKQGLAKNETNV